MKSCFGYIRVSTQKQGEGVSLEAQKEAITAFASRSNLTITEWFEEKETAAKLGRPVFTRMLKRLERGAASGLVTHKIDRSARNLKDWATIGELSDKGIDVYFATESLDFRSRGGRLTADIQAVIAADYVRNLREETIKGMNGRLKQGLCPWGAPLGYLNNGKGKPKTPDPIKAPMIKELFDLYASGQHSIRSLHVEMQRRGMRNRNNRPISLFGVEAILGNPFYCGIIELKRTAQQFEGLHAPLIPVRLFNRVQDIKSGRAGKKVNRYDHLYQGLFRCGLCKGPMTPERQKGHTYYRCQTRGCATKTVREDVIKAAVLTALQAQQIDDEEVRALDDSFKAEDLERTISDRRKSLELQIADGSARLERVADLLIDGTLDKESYQHRQKALKLHVAELTEELQKLPRPDQITRNRHNFLELMKTLADLHKTADPPEKREMIENCFSNRVVIEKQIVLEPHNWLSEPKNLPLSSRVALSEPHLELMKQCFEKIKGRSEAVVPDMQLERKPGVPKWKYNLKNQRLDDLRQ
jgi:site-specific DNA recombinase